MSLSAEIGGSTGRTNERSEARAASRESAAVRAERIVTTLPSATEIVSLLGLEDRLVGITHECDYPASIRGKQVVMRSVFDPAKMTSMQIDDSVMAHVRQGRPIYEIDGPLLRRLKPDLIITQELCEVCATPLKVLAGCIATLEPKPKVVSLSPHTLEDVLENIMQVGSAAGEPERARQVVSSLGRRIAHVKKECLESSREKRVPSVFCLEWLDPIYCSGHWMPELVEYAAGVEVIGRIGEPSTAVDFERVVKADPDVIFVTVCGYNVERALAEMSRLTEKKGWRNLSAVKKSRVYVLDGPSYYSRSGPRLVDGLEIMAYLLHPDLFPDYKIPRGAAYSFSEGRYVVSKIPK